MFRATVTDETVSVKSGTSKKGQPYTIREQNVLLETPNGERVRHRLSLDADELPLIKGVYEPKPTAGYRKGFDLIVSSRARDWKKAA